MDKLFIILGVYFILFIILFYLLLNKNIYFKNWDIYEDSDKNLVFKGDENKYVIVENIKIKNLN
jgi:hypothetical protein